MTKIEAAKTAYKLAFNTRTVEAIAAALVALPEAKAAGADAKGIAIAAERLGALRDEAFAAKGLCRCLRCNASGLWSANIRGTVVQDKCFACDGIGYTTRKRSLWIQGCAPWDLKTA